jgi:hypothetical protein
MFSLLYGAGAAIGAVGIKLWRPWSPTAPPVQYHCTHQYTTEILSIDPVMLYINNFVSEYEIDSLLNQKCVLIAQFCFNLSNDSIVNPTPT